MSKLKSSVVLRPARREDLEALHALDQQCFAAEIAYTRNELSHFLNVQDSLALVAQHRNSSAPAGFVLAQIYRARPTFQARLITIDVAPQWQRQGIGSLLLQACEQALRQRQVRRLRLEVAVGNTAAQALYKLAGYCAVGRIAAYYPTGEDALVMQKAL